MKRFSLIIITLFFIAVFVLPVSASAATNAGVKPGSFWYGFDIAFEKINLFFTFNSEVKARKALEYADERLAEAEAVAENNNTDAVKEAITNYESNIAFAAEKSKDVSDKEKAEALLTSIADNTSKHQEILADVLNKVPDEAKEAITKAIEASRKGQEEAMQKIAELKGEVEKLKQDVVELKSKDEQVQADEVEKLKKEIEELKNQPISDAPSKRQDSPIAPTPATPTAIDICKNIEGMQTTIPAGMRWDDNQNCVASELNVQPAPMIDLCNNIEGAQSYVPSSMTRDTNGNCIVPPAPIPTPISIPAPAPVITPATPIIPSSISVSVSKTQNDKKGDEVDVTAVVKDTSGNLLPNQTVIFQHGNSSAVAVTNIAGMAKVKFIGDYNYSSFKEADIFAKVLVPGTTDTFISNKTKVNAPYMSSTPQQGHLE